MNDPRLKLKNAIRTLLDERGDGKTICPSEAARAAAGSDKRGDWEPLMPTVREAAVALAASGEIVITQQGEPVDGRTARGPIRLRRS
ncbi:Protein of unknown function [Bryocella elongata]|uniref:S-adenosylmethionine tRNA ribosyltransferase n=1 Tax=Bryocella elongata TaxID=863522 RepID=A0A1H5YH45_9BACT|nr:DUF3253 domain-containing protein [Bryocella elongata]SEG22716.1 Protein of unknown function [Bryocella elongata]